MVEATAQNSIAHRYDEMRGKAPEHPKATYTMTRGVAELGPIEQVALWNKVAAFNDFNQSNDPHGEHDFGSIDHKGHQYFWKIDDYGQAGDGHKQFVLTLMRADEY